MIKSQNLLFSFSRGHDLKDKESRELQFLHPARRLMLGSTCLRCQEDILNTFLVTYRIQKHHRMTDGQTFEL